MRFGQWVSDCRKESGMTIDQLAEKSGVPKGTLNKIISGDTKEPSLDKAFAIVHAMGRTLDDYAPPKLGVEKSPAPAEPETGERLQEIADIFEQITDEGQEDIMKYSRYVATKPEYKKYTEVDGSTGA